jgi:hypothetical protein
MEDTNKEHKEENKEKNEEFSEKKELEEKSNNNNNNKNYTESFRKNPWIVSTIVLGILSLILITGGFGITGNVISEDEAGEIFLENLQSQGADIEDIEITNIDTQSGLYSIFFNYEGEEYPVPYYLTQDGAFLGMMSEISETEDSDDSEEIQEIPKSDKPEVELFVMSYCPHGTQAEKGIIPVLEVLGDKIDFRMRYVSYLMHGEKEADENLREYCIQEIAPDKYLEYMICYLEGDGIESDGYIMNGNDVNKCLNQAGIDKNTLEICMNEADEKFSITENIEDESSWLSGYYPKFNVDAELNEQYGIQGSPTLVINGQIVSSGRDSASYLDVICSAFNEVPEECSAELSSETPSPYFGWESSGTATNAQC